MGSPAGAAGREGWAPTTSFPPPSSESKQPFLLVKLRIRQADNQFCQEKLVLRCGTEKEFKVYSREWEEEGVDSSLLGEGSIVHNPADKRVTIYSRPGDSHKLTYRILQQSL